MFAISYFSGMLLRSPVFSVKNVFTNLVGIYLFAHVFLFAMQPSF